MLDPEELDRLELTVVLIGLAIGLVLGWISRFSNFCTLGAISDWYSSGDRSRLRMWLLAIAVAIIGTQALIAADLIVVKDAFYTAPRFFWLSYLLGRSCRVAKVIVICSSVLTRRTPKIPRMVI